MKKGRAHIVHTFRLRHSINISLAGTRCGMNIVALNRATRHRTHIVLSKVADDSSAMFDNILTIGCHKALSALTPHYRAGEESRHRARLSALPRWYAALTTMSLAKPPILIAHSCQTARDFVQDCVKNVEQVGQNVRVLCH